ITEMDPSSPKISKPRILSRLLKLFRRIVRKLLSLYSDRISILVETLFAGNGNHSLTTANCRVREIVITFLKILGVVCRILRSQS
ncbi:unnamed protein product, partial [Heterotrigona itama]